jgi:hypothetical protein
MAPARPRSAPRKGFAVLALPLAALGLLGAVAGCSTTSGGTPVTLSTTTTAGATDAESTTSTTAEPAASEGKELFVYAPVEGDCIDLRATGDNGTATTRARPDVDATPRGSKELILRLPCELPHQYEVIAVVDSGLPRDADDAAYVQAAKTRCPAAFATYVGTPYQDSSLEVGWVLPSPEQRGRGVQQIGCLAFDPDGKLTGTVRGSGR